MRDAILTGASRVVKGRTRFGHTKGRKKKSFNLKKSSKKLN